jgi:membrane associated rhomboid family serine protease
MFRSIWEDIKQSFSMGNMVTKIVIVNVAVYMILALTNALFPSFYQTLQPFIALPGDSSELLKHPWTLVTHMFAHLGFWHMAWNMLLFYWFGQIAGDLLGDRRVLPVYLGGGLAGALFYLISYTFLQSIGGYAMGASAGVLAVVFMAIATAPDYRVYMILFGPVRIKYIGLFIIFFDLIGTMGQHNSGGHIAHLGGIIYGFMFVYLLKDGIDLSSFGELKRRFARKKKPARKNPLKVEYKSGGVQRSTAGKIKASRTVQLQDEVDRILEKIKISGYDSLDDEEKNTLFKASKGSD